MYVSKWYHERTGNWAEVSQHGMIVPLQAVEIPLVSM